jgi:imidazolonepropionase-like amidohydrolase
MKMSERTLLANGKVLTCSGDPSERPSDGEILVEGNRIVAVSEGRLPVDQIDARVVDLGGATVLPGLCDAHTHISWPLDFVFDHEAAATAPPQRHILDVAAVARTFLESGYTLIIGAGVLQPDDDVVMKDFIDRGLMPGPRIVPSGPMVTEAGAIGDDSPWTCVASGPEDLRAIVARQCDTGVKAVKMFVSGDGILPEYPSTDTYMNDDMLVAAVDEAAKYEAIITVHARSSESVAMAARTGVQLIHHACFIDDKAMTALEARGDDVWVCPGMHYVYAMVNGHANPWGLTPDRLERSGYKRELDGLIEGIRKIHAAGVKILAGGDFGHQWTRHGTYAVEMQRYVELLEISPVEAIHTATRNVESLVSLRVGRIAEGYLADVLVVDGDPTDDITILQDPQRRRAVMKDGEFAYVNPHLFP